MDRTLFRKDVLSLRGTYIRENSDLVATYAAMGAVQPDHHLNTALVNAEYHFGNRLSGTVGGSIPAGTVDPLLYTQSPVTGSANGDPKAPGISRTSRFGRCRTCSSASNTPGIHVSTAQNQL